MTSPVELESAENDRLPIIEDVFDYPIKSFSVQSPRMVN